MKKIEKIKKMQLLIYDSYSARCKDWVLKLNKIYNGNQNDPLEQFVKKGLREEQLNSTELLNMWTKDKLNTWWINQDPEVNPLNNFSKHPVEMDVPQLGVSYTVATSEGYFQAAKFFRTDLPWAEKILNTGSASSTKRMGNDRSHPIDPNWNNGVSVERMNEVLFAKYRQHEEVRDVLAITKDRKIVERADWDLIWGDGPDGKGKNYLGKCWMFIRSVML